MNESSNYSKQGARFTCSHVSVFEMKRIKIKPREIHIKQNMAVSTNGEPLLKNAAHKQICAIYNRMFGTQ